MDDGCRSLPPDLEEALRTELERLGAHVETTADSITIDPSSCHDRPVTIADYNDHRIAMAMAVAALPRGAVRITNPACVTKSYPGFWRDLHALREVRR